MMVKLKNEIMPDETFPVIFKHCEAILGMKLKVYDQLHLVVEKFQNISKISENQGKVFQAKMQIFFVEEKSGKMID